MVLPTSNRAANPWNRPAQREVLGRAEHLEHLPQQLLLVDDVVDASLP